MKIDFKQLRTERGLTLKQLAAETKCSEYAISQLDKGMFGIATNVSFALLDYYGIKLVHPDDIKVLKDTWKGFELDSCLVCNAKEKLNDVNLCEDCAVIDERKRASEEKAAFDDLF